MNIPRIAQPARLRLIVAAVIVALAGLVIPLSQIASAGSAQADAAGNGPKPSIVLVHGAWADSGSWDGVTRRLQADGYTVYAPPNPLQGLPYDSAFLADFLHSISGPIVLVGHSHGGAVITNAATGDPQVKALVYVDAFAPARPKPGRLMTSEPTLTYQVYVAPIIAMAGRDVPPGQSRSNWSPISATLISGRHDVVLVDPLMTVEQGMAVADWVSTTGKNLTTVYVTHGHGDHWFGLGAVRERFPAVRAVATPAVIESMRKWSAPEALQTFWQPRFPGQIPDDNSVADPLDGPSFELEGHQLIAVGVGPTDTDDTTALHVPDLGLVVAGDAAYNRVHQYLAESGSQGRQDWLAALDVIESLDPRAVVAGHKRYGNDDGPRIIGETRQYIRDFDRLDQETSTAEELYRQMLAIYPDRVNPGALWLSVQAVKA